MAPCAFSTEPLYIGSTVSRNHFPDTWMWGQRGEEVEARLSVRAGFWQPVSKLIRIHHFGVVCAANEEDLETAGAVGTIQQLI